jgi:ATP-binding cassette subfamily F protein 3
VLAGPVFNFILAAVVIYGMLMWTGIATDKPVVGKLAALPVAEQGLLPRDEILALKADVRKCEERLAKLNDMRDKLAKKLADPSLYEDTRKGELQTWNGKYAEVMEALDRAEAMWLTAQEKLETANV